MIINNNIINNIKTNAAHKIRRYLTPFKFDLPKLKQLKQDIFELKEGTPEVLQTIRLFI